ncbi:MAG: ribosome-associated translation inhibitor RaiA [Kiritimatiellae bacterium]|nr:ribosome-associated translation inhibitor RaiA [Kiritimatiellia bacterium]
MQISVTGRHMEITDAIRSYVHDKVEHTLVDFPEVLSVHLILQVEKYRHLAEVVVQASHHVHVDAREDSSDMYASIDGALDKAAKQLRRHRDKVKDHKAREGLARVELDVQAAEERQGEGLGG